MNHFTRTKRFKNDMCYSNKMLESYKSPFQNHCSPLTCRFLDLFDIYSRAAAACCMTVSRWPPTTTAAAAETV